MNSKLSFKGASLFPCILASLLLCFIVSLLPCPLSAAPNLITYQGRLKESNLPVSGNRDITISLCDALADGAGTCYPSDRQSVYVSTGLFKHVFAVPGAVDLSSRDWWLQLKVDDTVLSPREQLSSVPYALNATTAAYANNLAASAGAAAVISSTHVYIVNGSSLTVSGDVSAHAFYGDGSGLSGLGGAASAGTANHIAGGSMGEILYQSGTDATAKLAAGDANKVLQANGAAAPSWTSAPTLTGTNFTGIPWAGVSKTNSSLADLATKSAGDLTSGLLGSTFGGTGANLSAAVAGGVPWFSATGVMGAVGAGTSGYFLKSNGAAAPEWVAPATVGAGLASNLAGGDKGSIPYQSAADHTILLGAGTAGAVLQTNGVSDTPPNWTSAPTLTGTNITGIPWAGVVKTNSSLADLATKSAGDLTSGTLVSARGGTGADLSGAPLGGVPWFSAIGVMGAVGAGTIGDLLKSNGEGAPSWVAASAALIGKASNLAGGDKGSIPYQSAADHTILLGAGTAGAVLQTNGVSDTPPSWTSAPTLTGTNFTGIPWAGVSKTNSSLADLATKSAGALDTGNLGVASK